MKIVKQPIDDYVITLDKTIKDALVVITNNHKGSVVAIDENGMLFGVLSDGDIRRALVQGATEFTPIEKIVNQNPKYLPDTCSEQEILEVFEKDIGVTLVPLVDTKNKVSGVATEAAT